MDHGSQPESRLAAVIFIPGKSGASRRQPSGANSPWFPLPSLSREHMHVTDFNFLCSWLNGPQRTPSQRETYPGIYIPICDVPRLAPYKELYIHIHGSKVFVAFSQTSRPFVSELE